MIISIGEKDNILYEGYLHSTPCNNCNHEEQNYVTIWAKSFVFGPWLLPIKWATWGKKAVVTCNNCKKTSDISMTTGNLRMKMDMLIKEYPLWKKNILGIIIVGYYGLSFVSSLIFWFLGLLFNANTPSQHTTEGSVTPSISFSPDSLKGVWIAPTVLVENNRESDMSSFGKQVVEVSKGEYEFEIFRFTKDNSFLGIKDGVFQESKWNLSKNEVQLVKGVNINADKLKFTKSIREGIELQTMKFFNEMPVNFNFQMYRFNLGKNEDAFFDYAKKLFNVKPQSDTEIKFFVKNALNYYSIYFQAINDSKLNGFKSTAIFLPIRFYSGGIGLTEFDEQEHWKKLYSNEKDAKKAYKYLEEAISKISTYPKRENIILEYSVVFKEMAEKL